MIGSGQPEIALDGTLDGNTLTLKATSQGAPLVLRLTFHTDTTFAGTFSAGNEAGTLQGRRRPPLQERGARTPTADPDSARLVVDDVRLFWDVLDRSTPATLAALLQHDYLENGSAAVRDFIPNRIISAERLAQLVTERRARYDGARAAGLALDTMEQSLRGVFRELKRIYPAAVFPDVHFVVGRLNAGGTVSPRGLLIGAEMYTRHEPIRHIVAHELVHYQQRSVPPDEVTLLSQSIHEGVADFVAELISGDHINQAAHEYGRAHERELWLEFRQVMHARDIIGWLYGNPPAGRPADLGYFFGYRIAEAYYQRAPDTLQALRGILRVSDHARLLRDSGYDPGS